jgi:resolvase-like protein
LRLAQAAAGDLGHLDFVQVLCEDEITRRASVSLTKRIRRARFQEQATLDKALAYLREGDVLVITRLSRAMRSLKHLLALADELRERGVGLVVLRQ